MLKLEVHINDIYLLCTIKCQLRAQGRLANHWNLVRVLTQNGVCLLFAVLYAKSSLEP